MKKFKLVLALLLTFALTGCIDISMDVSIKNNDSGTIKYVFACQTQYCNSDNEESSSMVDENDFKDVPNATAKEITYTKDDIEYKGTEVNITFKSLDEFNSIMTKMNNNEDDEESTTTTKILSATRDGSKVTLKMDADKEGYDNSASMLPYIKYAMNITIESKVLSHNADSYDEKTNTYSWNVTTMLKEGINLAYDTSTFNLLYIGIAGGVLILIIVIVILLTRKNNKPMTTEPITVEEPKIIEQPIPTMPNTPEVLTTTQENPTPMTDNIEILDVNPTNNNQQI